MVDQKRQELRQAVRDCRERGLYSSAKWAAVQLAGLPPGEQSSSTAEDSFSVVHDDTFELARSYFDVKVRDQIKNCCVLINCYFILKTHPVHMYRNTGLSVTC